MTPGSGASTQKPRAGRSRKRALVRRGIPAVSGSGNLFVVKSGEELQANLAERLDAMKKDFEKVEFFWSKLIRDPEFHGTREFPELSMLVSTWELREGVKDLAGFKSRMKRLKVLLDHFQPGKDYELTVNEVVEIVS